MKTSAERAKIRLEKRKQIEEEMRQILYESNRKILLENLRRRRRHEFHKGDLVTVIEWVAGGYGHERDAERLYRVTEGKVIEALPGGYYIEGKTARGHMARDFVNRAHIINGTVKMIPRSGE